MEFDTLEEFKQFDNSFEEFMNENLDQSNEVIKVFSKYSEVKSYHSVPTVQKSGRLHLNENLFKPSPKCLEVLKNITMEDLYLYDLGRNDELVETLSSSLGISSNNIFIHNGSAEVIKSIGSILLNENDIVLIPSPGWSYYKSVADAKFAKCITYEVCEKEDTYEYNIEDLLTKGLKKNNPKVIIITSPQMPTGCGISYNDIEKVIRENTDVPCAIGFGISTPEQAKKMADISDGAIVGSAIIKLLEKHGKEAPDYIGEYVRSMKNAIR